MKLHAQQDKRSALVKKFCKVLDGMPIGNEYRDLAGTYSPLSRYRRWKTERYLQPPLNNVNK
jgi:hypothetical protein